MSDIERPPMPKGGLALSALRQVFVANKDREELIGHTFESWMRMQELQFRARRAEALSKARARYE